MTGQDHDFSHLDRVGRVTASISRNPRLAVTLVFGAGVLLAWLLLGAMAIRGAESRIPGTDAPGDLMLRNLPQLPLPDFLERFFTLCLAPAPLDGGVGAQGSALVLMWFLMAIATMLPSAAPMIRTYCEIADTARVKGEPVVHPLILVAGYVSVWLVASAAFAVLTLIVNAFASPVQMLDPVVGATGAAALSIAGLYQFSGLKEACLTKCRNPFAVLFSNWSAKPGRIFRLGMEQGVWCLGCCWALMLVMFAVGVMNVFWMALIGLFTLIEKQTAGRLPTRIAGAILLVWATALLVVSV
ncbi:putative metal-binding membrane protein [Mesorhizobium robiniae]|uniref:Metal-binding membrane protein n=1 Tax=Mesorhizobium robiniae TaxID=559315 RepID=A0ABV2GR29_9HYPH